MEEQYLLDFLQLRQEGKIGRMWPPNGKGMRLLTPDGILPGCDHKNAEPVSEQDFRAIIDDRMGRIPLPERKRMGLERNQVYLPKGWRKSA